MALKATIYKADLQIADMDRHYYATHALTIALHPSETEERMMVRVLAFACHAHEQLIFAKGLSVDDEPDLWQKDYTGAIDVWIDVGLPDEKRIRKACGRSAKVIIYTYGGHAAQIWWQQNKSALARLKHLQVFDLPDTKALSAIATRSMQLQATLQDGEFWLADGVNAEKIDIERKQ